MGQNDIMIATIALSLGNTTVVMMDSDLAAIPGLTVENWAEVVAELMKGLRRMAQQTGPALSGHLATTP